MKIAIRLFQAFRKGRNLVSGNFGNAGRASPGVSAIGAGLIAGSAILIGLMTPGAALAEGNAPPAPPSASQLAEITARGKLLKEYQLAHQAALEAFEKEVTLDGPVFNTVSRRTDKGWETAFGKTVRNGEAFQLRYIARSSDGGPAHLEKTSLEDHNLWLPAVRALDTAWSMFRRLYIYQTDRQYEIAVLPAADGKMWVYCYPAREKPSGVWPLGQDARFLISRDGQSVIENRQLHTSEIEAAPKRDAPTGSHKAVMAETPEDTDVFNVLMREPKKPERISSNHFVFDVKPDGTIELLGSTAHKH